MSAEIEKLVSRGWAYDSDTGNLRKRDVGQLESHASGTGARFFYAWVAGRGGKPGHYIKDARGRFFCRFRSLSRAANAVERGSPDR